MQPKKIKPFTVWMRLRALVYRMRYGSDFKHMSRYAYWLGLNPTKDGRYDVSWKGAYQFTTQSWAAFPHVEGGQLNVIATGPSVREQDLNRLQGESVLVNGAVSLACSGQVARPLAVIVEDGRFIQQRAALMQELPKGTRLILSVSALFACMRVCPEVVESHPVFLMQGLLYPWGLPQRSFDECDTAVVRFNEHAGLSLDLSAGHVGCGTVMYAGVQLGFHLNVRRLALVGVDLTNFDSPRFYEREGDKAWSGVANAYSQRILPALELAVKTANEFGMEIVNCSPTSIIPRDLIPYSAELSVGE